MLCRHGAVVQLLRRPDKGRNVQVQALPAPPLFHGNRAAQVLYSMHQLVEAAKMLRDFSRFHD